MAEMTPENIRLKKLLAHVQNELLEQIDGGEETRGRDTWISGLIREIGHGLDTSYPFDIGPKIMQEAIRQAKQAAYERAAKVARKRAQRHADAANASKRKGMSIDATYESHRAKTAKEIEDEIRALGKETETER